MRLNEEHRALQEAVRRLTSLPAWSFRVNSGAVCPISTLNGRSWINEYNDRSVWVPRNRTWLRAGMLSP